MINEGITSAIPAVVRGLADEVPQLYVQQSLAERTLRHGPPPEFVERTNARRFAEELAPFVKHEWQSDFVHDARICRSSISKPLSYAELVSLLSRAYEAGRRGR